MKKITLTRVFRSTTNKEGQPLISKIGKPYEKLSIKCAEYGDSWLSGFGNKDNEKWAEGAVVEVTVVEKAGANGMVYLNFDMPKAEDILSARITALEMDVLKLKQLVAGKGATLTNLEPVKSSGITQTQTPTQTPTRAPSIDTVDYGTPVNLEDIPF